MNTDKNKLLMAMGEIDDKYISEILKEDSEGIRKKKTPVIRYMKYYIPAAAALLIAIVCIRSASRVSYDSHTATGSTAAPEQAAVSSDMASTEESDSYMDSASEKENNYSLNAGGWFDFSSSTSQATSEPAYEDASLEEVGGARDSDANALGLANPFVSCDTIEMAEEYAGLTFDIPDDLLDGYDTDITAVDGQMIQVIFSEDGKRIFRIRKGFEDISGDYNSYACEYAFEENGISGVLKGNDENDIRSAVWQDPGYWYSFSSEDGVFSRDEVMEIIFDVTSPGE